MTEYPIFIRHGRDQLAAIVTVPDETPKSLVMFVQGWGAPRSHRYGLWSRIARQLAEHQIAAVRFDYPQMGDSTGIFKAALNRPPSDVARVAVDVAREALGVEKYGVIGNCVGLLAAFELAMEDPACLSVGCFLTDPPTQILRDKKTPTYQQTAQRVSRKVPKLRRVARRYFHVRKGSLRHGLIPQVEKTLQSTDILFLLTGSEETGRRLTANVSALRRQLGGNGAIGRAEVQTIAATGTEKFQLPLTTHPQLVDSFVRWMTETLPSGSHSANGSEIHSLRPVS